MDRRKKILKYLKLRDAEKFNWLCKELKIKFVPALQVERWEKWKYMKPYRRTKRRSAFVKVTCTFPVLCSVCVCVCG